MTRDDLVMLDKFVIKKDSTWKGIFDLVMLLVSCYNIFGNAYYAAFGVPTQFYDVAIDWFVELLFLADMIFMNDNAPSSFSDFLVDRTHGYIDNYIYIYVYTHFLYIYIYIYIHIFHIYRHFLYI